MSNLRKVLAVSAGAALGFASLVGVPANAASANNVTLALSDGAGTALFNSDTFNVDVTKPTFVTDAIHAANFMIVINNPDSTNIRIDFEGVGADYNFTFAAVDANGDATGGSAAYDEEAENTAATLDFATGDAVTGLLYAFQDGDGADAAIAPTKIEISRLAADDDYGDDGISLGLTATLDADGDFTTVDTASASATLPLSFVDPATVSVITKLERVIAADANYFNLPGDELTGTIRFSNPNINLDQTDITAWDWDVYTGAAIAANDDDVTPVVTSFFDGNDEHDDAGRIVAHFPVDADLAVDTTYQVKVVYDGQTRVFSSTGFEVVSSASLADDFDADVAITETANIADDDANGITLRTGTASATWTYTADVAEANIPVVVYATSTNNGEISLVGASGTAEEGQSVMYTTLTNADGEVSVTVTSLTAADGDTYTINAILIEDDGTSAAAATQTVTYADAAVTSWETDSTVLSGESLSITATIVDQFGEGIDLSGTKQMNVGVVATDDADLDVFAATSGGSATFTFANYLATGGSDVLTVNAYTGANDDQSTIAGLNDISVTLYAAIATSAVNVTSDEVDATVVYVDFADEMDAPAGASKGTINGTVIDATGSGVPGAQVTLSAPAGSLIFENAAGDILVDSMTVSAGEAGTFEVDVWTHIADDVDVTISSGGKSATVTVAGALPTADNSISAANLLFSWTLTEVVVVNTTYRVDALLTDVWGNGIANATVNFNGEAAAQFNSEATVAKTTNADGRATAYLRSLEDVTGLAAVSVDYEDNIDIDGANNAEVSDAGDTFTDDEDTSWDESAATNEIEAEVNFLATAPAASSSQKVNAGSFKGYVAVYAKGYEGQRLSAKVGKDWVIVPALASDFVRVVEFTGAGVDVAVRIYIDRVLVDTINLTTK